MNQIIICKGLAVAVILLFLGVGIQPSVANIKTNNIDLNSFNQFDIENDYLVNISIQFCNHDGIENYNILITEEQEIKLNNLIDDFKAELDTIETPQEATAIYKELVVSLYELDLFPEDISLKEVQQLVFEDYQNLINEDFFDDLSFKKQPYSEKLNNMLCQVSGETTFTIHDFRTLKLIPLLVMFFDFLYFNTNIYVNDYLVIAILEFILQYALSHPILVGHIFGIGLRSLEIFYYNFYLEEYPAEGWIHTSGLLGVQQIEGDDLWGKLLLPPRPVLLTLFFNPGVLGFIGIRINKFYIGSALHVKVVEKS